RADTVGGNLIPRERRLRCWIVDRNQHARRGSGVRKIALPLQRRRHRVGIVDGVPVTQIIPREEEEQFLPALVESGAWNNQWATEGDTGILITVPRLLHVQLVVEPFVGVEHLVAPVIIRAAMEL